jgi:hypothetical protein
MSKKVIKMPCDETSCLDSKEKTKVVFGSNVMKLDEFEQMIEKDNALKNKMKMIEEKLKEY